MDQNKEIPKSAKEAIASLKERGVYVAIATGRAPFMFKELREELGIESYVSFNGSYVVYEGEVIARYPLPVTRLQALEEAANGAKHSMVFLDHEGASSNQERDPLILESMASLKMEHPPFQPDFYRQRQVYQALLFCKEPEEALYLTDHQDFNYVRWHDFSLDVLPGGGSKARGIKRLLDHVALAPDKLLRSVMP